MDLGDLQNKNWGQTRSQEKLLEAASSCLMLHETLHHAILGTSHAQQL